MACFCYILQNYGANQLETKTQRMWLVCVSGTAWLSRLQLQPPHCFNLESRSKICWMLNSRSPTLDLCDCERGRISPRHDNITFFVVFSLHTSTWITGSRSKSRRVISSENLKSVFGEAQLLSRGNKKPRDIYTVQIHVEITDRYNDLI